MKLIKKPFNQTFDLEFVAEGNETTEELAFLEKIKKYKLLANGASVHVLDGAKQIAKINPFDNTIFVMQPEAIALAAEFGGKRFIVGDARKALTEAQAAEAKAIHFDRDRSFSMFVEGELESKYKAVTFTELKNINRTEQHKMYAALAALFEGAPFTPGKMEEYISKEADKPKYSGAMLDKFDRFNSGNLHLFLIDGENNIVATISFSPEGNYFYDEIVAAKSETERKELMAQLFAATRRHFCQFNIVEAFIRVASKLEKDYEELGCGIKNTDFYVIHGGATPFLKMIDAFMKDWAYEQLVALEPKLSAVSRFQLPAPATAPQEELGQKEAPSIRQ